MACCIFLLALGTILAIAAFPILFPAKILRDRRRRNTLESNANILPQSAAGDAE